MPEHDAVNHPPHYTSLAARCDCGRPIECIQVTQHMNFPVGCAVKYCWRLDAKDEPIQELRKAIRYLEYEIKRREGQNG